jgi:hypothetical protein
MKIERIVYDSYSYKIVHDCEQFLKYRSLFYVNEAGIFILNDVVDVQSGIPRIMGVNFCPFCGEKVEKDYEDWL